MMPGTHGGARPGAGRKKGTLRAELLEIMQHSCPLEDRKAIVKRMKELAALGHIGASSWIFDRLYGRAGLPLDDGIEDESDAVDLSAVPDEVLKQVDDLLSPYIAARSTEPDPSAESVRDAVESADGASAA